MFSITELECEYIPDFQYSLYFCKIDYYFCNIILPSTELVKMNISDFHISLNAVLLTRAYFTFSSSMILMKLIINGNLSIVCYCGNLPQSK
jgi:hypothetical protein